MHTTTTITRLLAILATTAALQGGAFAQATIKLGVVNIDTGPFAVSGAFVNDGAAFAVERLNAQGGALGRKYELVTQNHAGTPASAPCLSFTSARPSRRRSICRSSRVASGSAPTPFPNLPPARMR